MAKIDMSLISVKDGGTFAMTWVAGTNPNALHSNFPRAHIYAVDIPEKCEKIMELIKFQKNKLSFRILFKLFFGTIHIFAEQVQHLYCVTQNVVCFNKFIFKQYSNKRTRSMVTDGNTSKRRRLESSTDFDIISLLNESEIFDDYSEEKFKFPNEMNGSNKKITSTCIEIQQIQKITIRQISWDNPPPEKEEEEAFGEATQDEQIMLMSEFSADETPAEPTPQRKRKSSNEVTDCLPFKKPNSVCNESIDDIRYSPSFCKDTVSEFSVDLRNQPTDAEESHPNSIDQISTNTIAFEDLNKISTAESLTNVSSTTELVFKKPEPRIKRQLIVDKVKQFSKNYMETFCNNIWINCYDRDSKEHIAKIDKYREHADINERAPRRFQSKKLDFSSKSRLKHKLTQNDVNLNRQLIIEEILGTKFSEQENIFKPKANCKKFREPCREETVEEFHTQSFEINNNIPTEIDKNNNSFLQTNGNCKSRKLQEDVTYLKCSLDKINPREIDFDFPTEAETQRSEWGKEGILLKLLFAWKTRNIINMNTIIVGASRINAALAFRTLLDLAGQQYIEIVKDNNQSIESIKMGPEIIRRLNIIYDRVN